MDIEYKLSWDGLDPFGFIQTDILDCLKHGEMVRLIDIRLGPGTVVLFWGSEGGFVDIE